MLFLCLCGFSSGPWFPPTVQENALMSIGDCWKLLLKVEVCPVMDWQMVEGVLPAVALCELEIGTNRPL